MHVKINIVCIVIMELFCHVGGLSTGVELSLNECLVHRSSESSMMLI